MQKTKLRALLVILVMSLVLVSGCSQAELGLIDLMSEVNNLDVYESQETVALKINKLPSDLTKEDPLTFAIVQSMLSKYLVKSNVRMDANQGVFDGTFYLVDTVTGSEKQIMSFVGSGNVVYVKIDDLVAFCKTFGYQELNRQLAIFGDAQYLSISSKDLTDAMLATGQPVYNITNIKKQQALYQKLMDGLTQQVFDEYETGMVKQNGNKFTLTIDKQSVLNNLEPFLAYSINNAEKISSFSTSFLQSLDTEELAMLSLTPQTKTTVISEINEVTNDVIANRSLYLSQVSGMSAAAQQGSSMVGDKTGLTIVAEKLGNESYKQTADLVFNISDPYNPSDAIDIALNSTAEINGIDPFTVTVPTTGIISLTELQKRMPRVLTIDTTRKQYTYNQGFKYGSGAIEVRIVKGRIYLPVRTVGNAMNETVGWNSTIKQAYVIKNGKTINLAGAIFNGRAFIKIRDFEKLGYTVIWNSATKTATLSQ